VQQGLDGVVDGRRERARRPACQVLPGPAKATPASHNKRRYPINIGSTRRRAGKTRRVTRPMTADAMETPHVLTQPSRGWRSKNSPHRAPGRLLFA